MTVIHSKTHIRCQRCAADSPEGMGVVEARQLARQAGWRADGSRKPDLCPDCLAGTTPQGKREAEIVNEYEALVERVGKGFHPDTPFSDYVPPIDFMSEGEFQAILDNIFGIPHLDPYKIGLAIFFPEDDEPHNKCSCGSRDC